MLTVRYALTREELRAWYKAMWLRKLWVFHAAIAVLLSATFAMAEIGGSTLSGFQSGVAASALIIVFMIVWPQIRYRADERTLTFDAEGLSYVRGSQTGFMAWKQIASVADTPEGVVVTGRSLSAFIVPTRAFGGEAEKVEAFRTISELCRRAS
ncbi:YcxB family protein [Brevundimonas sp.]|uniref:YcxB family protein n=1 Tax=Brevundimonas sp. TaxID=1871086 RepID=UPI003F6F8A4D